MSADTYGAVERLNEDADCLVGLLTKTRAEGDHLRAALAELVALKDGPRDAEYERRKPLAWQAARDALEQTRER